MVGMFTPWKSPSATNQKSFLFQHTNRAKYPSKRDWFGLPWWLSGKEFSCQCRRYGFDPQSGEIPHASKQLSLCATTIEPVLRSPRAAIPDPCVATTGDHAPQSPCSATREATTLRRPRTTTRKWSLLTTSREKLVQQQRLSRAKILKIKKQIFDRFNKLGQNYTKEFQNTLKSNAELYMDGEGKVSTVF